MKRGRGSPAVPWRANTGEGRERKMKLRFVKIFTSSENEIEKKEEGGGRNCALLYHPASPRPEPMLRLPPPAIVSTLPPLRPTSPLLHHSSFSSATCRKSNALQLSLPSCSASPFFIKLPKRKSVEEGPGRAPTLPTQLSYPQLFRFSLPSS